MNAAISYNVVALTTPLNWTCRALIPGEASLPVKGCGCHAPAIKQMHPATQGTHTPCSYPTCHSVSALLGDGPCPAEYNQYRVHDLNLSVLLSHTLIMNYVLLYGMKKIFLSNLIQNGTSGIP